MSAIASQVRATLHRVEHKQNHERNWNVLSEKTAANLGQLLENLSLSPWQFAMVYPLTEERVRAIAMQHANQNAAERLLIHAIAQDPVGMANAFLAAREHAAQVLWPNTEHTAQES